MTDIGYRRHLSRIHGAMKLEWGDSPKDAFVRKLMPELLGLLFDTLDCDLRY